MSAVYSPYNSYIKYVEEASYGAGGTCTIATGVVQNFTPTMKNNLFKIIGIGEGRDYTRAVWGPLDVSGTMDVMVTPETLDFFQFLIGVKSGSGTTGTPYLLTENDRIGTGASDIGTVCIEMGSEAGTTDDVDKYEGVHLTSATLTAAQGAVLMASVNWVAKSVTSSTSAGSYTAAAYAPYVFQAGGFSWGGTPTEVLKVSSFAVTINNNSFIYRSLGSRKIEQPETGLRTYDFTITCKMSDAVATTLRDDFYGSANTPFAGTTASEPTADLEIDLDFTISADNQMHVYLDDCYLEEMSKPIPVGNDLVEVTFSGWAETGKTNIPISWWLSA